MRVYLAGPEVFLPDAREILATKAALSRARGFQPVTPLDNDLPPGGDRFATGMRIYRSNIALMNGCDAIVANLTPFRGVGADPGTCFELGYMVARGARIAAYSNDPRGHFDRLQAGYYHGAARTDAGGEHRGPDGLALENFDMFDNLMLHGAAATPGAVLVVAPPGAAVDADRLSRGMETFVACLARLAEAGA